MDIDEKAPGNISQSPVTRSTDNETGFDPNASNEPDTGNTAPLPPDIPLDEDDEPSPGNRI
ncbi:hypothetical protein PS3A_19440 [Pseudomonas sp. 3A(2025)]